MTHLLIGNAAVARGVYEAGCRLVSSYPGTPSTEITEVAATYPEIACEWAPNEKVALEAAFGASLAGGRACCAMKHVGLNVAADPLFTLAYTGVRGGVLIVVADDPGMHSSQNEQDSRHYAVAAKLPMLEPSDSVECKEFAKLAFDLSERFDTPVLLRTCTRIAHAQCPVEFEDRVEHEPLPYEKDPKKYIMTPANAIARHPVLEERLAALADYADHSPLNRIEWGEGEGAKLGIIASGTCYRYVREALGDAVPVLKLGMIHPLPKRLIREFAAGVERLVVVEELDPVLENAVRAMGIAVEGKNLFPVTGEFSQNTVRAAFGVPLPQKAVESSEDLPARPPVMCPGCPHRGLYYVLAKMGLTVLGDIGCYTLGSAPPLNALDSTLCMGASVSGLHGFNKIRGARSEGKTVCVIGDSTFMHSGMTGLVNISYNDTNSTVIILDNSITGMTGHQQNPTTGFNIKGDPAAKVDLEALCHALGIERVRVVDPYDLDEVETALREELAVAAPSVIISRRPCVLLKYVKTCPPLAVDEGACRSCRACMKLGCPAIRLREGDDGMVRANIDDTLCIGCGVCREVCRFDAITAPGGQMRDLPRPIPTGK